MIFDKVLDCSAEVGVDPVVLVEDGGVQRRVVSDQRRRAKKHIIQICKNLSTSSIDT